MTDAGPLPGLSQPRLTDEQLRSHRLATRLLLPLLVALAVIVVPLYLLYDNARVTGTSMLPTLRNGDYLLITRGWRTPARGDIIVVNVHNPDGTIDELVKRAVGLPGDTLAIRGDTASVNGRPEPYAETVVAAQTTEPVIDTVVPTGTVFVLGDDRPVSDDSRHLGPLPMSDVHGRVIAIWGPIGRVRLVP
ncbi:MAG TPA: signal peptidase I [Coriobacteriia bacterium]